MARPIVVARPGGGFADKLTAIREEPIPLSPCSGIDGQDPVLRETEIVALNTSIPAVQDTANANQPLTDTNVYANYAYRVRFKHLSVTLNGSGDPVALTIDRPITVWRAGFPRPIRCPAQTFALTRTDSLAVTSGQDVVYGIYADMVDGTIHCSGAYFYYSSGIEGFHDEGFLGSFPGPDDPAVGPGSVGFLELTRRMGAMTARWIACPPLPGSIFNDNSRTLPALPCTLVTVAYPDMAASRDSRFQQSQGADGLGTAGTAPDGLLPHDPPGWTAIDYAYDTDSDVVLEGWNRAWGCEYYFTDPYYQYVNRCDWLSDVNYQGNLNYLGTNLQWSRHEFWLPDPISPAILTAALSWGTDDTNTGYILNGTFLVAGDPRPGAGPLPLPPSGPMAVTTSLFRPGKNVLCARSYSFAGGNTICFRLEIATD